MKRFYTAESVTEGHPDKLCDLIADSILDECLKGDPEARVACEVFATKGTVLLAGESRRLVRCIMFVRGIRKGTLCIFLFFYLYYLYYIVFYISIIYCSALLYSVV